MKTQAQIKFTPAGWQTDPDSIKTDRDRVQLWSPDTMLGVISASEARQMIRNGTHFVISSQAIGYLQPVCRHKSVSSVLDGGLRMSRCDECGQLTDR